MLLTLIEPFRMTLSAEPLLSSLLANATTALPISKSWLFTNKSWPPVSLICTVPSTVLAWTDARLETLLTYMAASDGEAAVADTISRLAFVRNGEDGEPMLNGLDKETPWAVMMPGAW